MRVLTFTSLYPSVARPRHGIFVETRLRHVRRCCGTEFRVVAPVPWSPSGSERLGDYGLHARTPREEARDGLQVLHPRFLNVPGAGLYTAPFAMALAGAGALRRLRREGFDFDVIDAHYFYPDGVAAAMLARQFATPLAITARGTDVNLLPRHPLARRLITWAARQASAVVAVSDALRARLAEIGVDGDRISVLRNGVDCEMFRPLPMGAARAALGIGPGRLFASVGNLVVEKGHDLAIEAIARLPGATLVVVGDGPERGALARLAQRLGIADRVRMLPAREQRELATVYSAADALLLLSSREGWPNVVLEAMACGTPVVATAVGGVPEIVRDRDCGVLVRDRRCDAVVDALREFAAAPPDRARVREHAERFGWDDVALRIGALFAAIATTRRPSALARPVSE